MPALLTRRAGIIAAGAATPALVRNHLGQNFLTGTTFTISVTPTPNSLLLLSGFSRRNTGSPGTHTCAGGGTWISRSGDFVFVTNGVRVSKWSLRMGASPGTFNITFTATTNTNCSASVEEFINASDDLSNVSPIGKDTTAGDPTATLPNAPAASSIVIGNA